MALGWHEAIAYPYVILNGDRVFINREHFRAEDLGKLVQVIGKLRVEHYRPDPRYVVEKDGAILSFNGAPTQAFDYYIIDVQQWRVLDRVTWPWMKVVDTSDKRSFIKQN